MPSDMKNCPFCGKEIRARAFVCKHCKKTVGEAEEVVGVSGEPFGRHEVMFDPEDEEGAGTSVEERLNGGDGGGPVPEVRGGAEEVDADPRPPQLL